MLDKIKDKLRFADIVFLATLFLTGGFNEYVSCFLNVAISIYFLTRVFSKKRIEIRINAFSLAIMAICLFYGLTCFWATDSGMAFIGFLKYLPIGLYLILLWQEKPKNEVLDIVPYFAVVLVLISAIGAQIPALKAFFVVAERFAGVFQYPNTFALFLLICELLLLQKSKLKVVDYISICVLIGGILYTGSRTVFLLFLASNFAMILLMANKKVRLIFVGVMIASAMAVAVLMFVFKDHAIINRYLSMDFGASTLVGRLLYVVDSLPLLLKYPFGMGYMGYYYIQNSIQTGLYNVVYIHNDFLQIFLDIGWIPGLLFAFAMAAFFFKKSVSLKRKLIVGTFCLHTLFDFNLQFVAMFFFLIILVDWNEGKTKTVKVTSWLKGTVVAMAVLNLYMATALLFAHYEQLEIANTMYPYNTRNSLKMMEEESELKYAAKIADKIIKQNDTYFAPYSVKAKYAYTIGDFEQVIINKNAAISRYPFKYTEHKEYCVMLINGITLFAEQGDEASINICNQEVLATYEKLESNKTRLSALGRRIEEQPTLEFSDSVLEYINKLKKATE